MDCAGDKLCKRYERKDVKKLRFSAVKFVKNVNPYNENEG